MMLERFENLREKRRKSEKREKIAAYTAETESYGNEMPTRRNQSQHNSLWPTAQKQAS